MNNYENKEFDMSNVEIETVIDWINNKKLSGFVILENEKEKGELHFIYGAMISAKLGLIEGERAVISFITWDNGKAVFNNYTSENKQEGIEENIVYETELLIKACAKERKVINKMKDSVKNLDNIYEMIDSGKATYIKTTELTVLPWIDGHTTIREIAQEMGKDYPGVLKSVHKLYKDNIIRKRL